MYDESQPEPFVEPDTENRTKFHGNDPDANYDGEYRLDKSRKFKNHYHRLSRHNCGVLGKWYDQGKRRRADNLGIFDAVANFLELPTYQHTVARTEFERVPLREWSSPNGIDVILVSIMICAIICRKDPRFGREYNPDRNNESNDELFVQLLDRLRYRKSEIRSCYQKALSHVWWEPVDWTAYRSE